MGEQRKKIAVACVVGCAILTVAVYTKFNHDVPVASDTPAIVSVAAAPRAHIPVSDQDGDGVPDWQEALQRTEPIILEEIAETYEPSTLTEEFSIDFFQDMMLSENYGDLGSDPESLAEMATNKMSEFAKDKLYDETHIVISNDTSEAAIKAYVNGIAIIILDQTLPENSMNEVEILQQAYATENPERLKELTPIIESYKDMLDRTIATPVPKTYVKEHLDLINVYNALYNDIVAMKMGFVDPLKTVVRLKRYQEDATALYVVLLNVQKKAILQGVTFTEADPAYRFILTE